MAAFGSQSGHRVCQWHQSLLGVRRAKAAIFCWVKAPPGEMLRPEAAGAVVEVTKWLKPFRVK